MANKYDNMLNFVKLQAENSVMKEMSHKMRYTPEFFGYILDHNFRRTQGISMKFDRYLKDDRMRL